MSVDLSVDRTWQVRTLGPVVLLMALVTTALAATEPSVLSSTREEIHFSLDLAEPQWQAGPRIDGDPTWELWIDGCVSMALPGQIRTPRQGGWLVIPPGTTPRLEVVKEDFFQQVRELKQVSVVSDPSVARGGARIETAAGEVDTGIESRLEAVTRAVMQGR